MSAINGEKWHRNGERNNVGGNNINMAKAIMANENRKLISVMA
jgi:hypothetical protein